MFHKIFQIIKLIVAVVLVIIGISIIRTPSDEYYQIGTIKFPPQGIWGIVLFVIAIVLVIWFFKSIGSHSRYSGGHSGGGSGGGSSSKPTNEAVKNLMNYWGTIVYGSGVHANVEVKSASLSGNTVNVSYVLDRVTSIAESSDISDLQDEAEYEIANRVQEKWPSVNVSTRCIDIIYDD